MEIKNINHQQNNKFSQSFGSMRLPVYDGIPDTVKARISAALPRLEKNGDLYKIAKTEEGSKVKEYLKGMLRGNYGDVFEDKGILSGMTMAQNDVFLFHVIPTEHNSETEKSLVTFLKSILGKNSVFSVSEKIAHNDVKLYDAFAKTKQVFPKNRNPYMN